MKPLYLDWNLGLGDAIICNGMVRWLARDRDLIVASWNHNLPTVTHMFSDLKNVQVMHAGEARARHRDGVADILRVGITNPKWGLFEPWDEAFYYFAGVPFEAKWDLFHVPKSSTEMVQPPKGRFDLYHCDTARGFVFDPGRNCTAEDRMQFKIEPRTPLLTDWRLFIRDAVEIHMIDSAPMHLAELLPTTGKLFYHKYARSLGNRNHRDATFRKPWVVLE